VNSDSGQTFHFNTHRNILILGKVKISFWSLEKIPRKSILSILTDQKIKFLRNPDYFYPHREELFYNVFYEQFDTDEITDSCGSWISLYGNFDLKAAIRPLSISI